VRYRKVAVEFWNDRKIRTFDDAGKLAFLAVLTNPAMTSVGAMRGTLAGVAAELGWPLRKLERALAPAIDGKMIVVDAAAYFITMPNRLKHNRPENPNVYKGWAAAIMGLPECPERLALIGRCREHLRGCEKGFAEAFEKGLANRLVNGQPTVSQPFRIPGQEQEQEQVPPYPPTGGLMATPGSLS